MIRNRLSELLAERGLKNARVARDIKSLSRNTINATTSNRGKMIQLETVNTLCRYLGIEPGEFFEYLPFDVDISINSDSNFLYDDSLENLWSNEEIAGYRSQGIVAENYAYRMPSFYLNLYIEKEAGNSITGITKKVFELSVVLENDVTFYTEFGAPLIPSSDLIFEVVLGNPPGENTESNKQEFLHFWNEELTPGFRKELTNTIYNKIYEYVEKNIYRAPNIDWGKQVYVEYNFVKKEFDNLESSPKIIIDELNSPGMS